MNEPGALQTSVIHRRKSVTRVETERLDGLEADQIAAGNRLLDLLPMPPSGEPLLEALGDELERLVGTEHDVFFHTLRTHRGSKMQPRWERALVSPFRLEPDPDQGLVILDMTLVGAWLDALLGDEPPEARTVGRPSPRDFGLITYVLVQLVQWLCRRGLPPVSLASAPPDRQVLMRRLQRQATVTEAVFGITTPSCSAQARLILPGELIRSLEVFARREKRYARQRRRLTHTRMGHLRARLAVAVASMGLSTEELAGLGPGDLLLPDEHGLCLESVDGPQGAARLWLGRSSDAFLPCLVEPSDDTWRVEVTDTIPRTRREETMSEQQSSGDESADNSRELIDRTRLDLEVRLGSVPMAVSTLTQLQSGYVLELNRRIEEPVDLVVDGESVGTGELVSVEGRLGVRVVAIE